jgi:hypothetical protein
MLKHVTIYIYNMHVYVSMYVYIYIDSKYREQQICP